MAFFLCLAVLAGITSALQSGSNNSLQHALSTPWWTIAIVSGVTFAASILSAVSSGERFATGSALALAPWWAWIGGVFGIMFVIGTVFASPKLGAGVFLALTVTASTVTSLILDHYGLMSFDVRQAGVGRIAGGLLMIAGVVLIAKF